jgi:hypothetical protein
MDLSFLTRSPHLAMLVSLLRSSHGPKLIVIFVLLTLTGFYLFSSPQTYTSYLPDIDLPDLPSGHDVSQFYHSALTGKQAVFIEEAMAHDIDGSWDNRTISALCQSRIWVDGLIIKCDAPEGGVANVRNVVLNCVRYAIEAGGASYSPFSFPSFPWTSELNIFSTATGFVIPEISVLTAQETQTPVALSHFFDLEHLKSSLTATCPQMTLYDHQNDLYNFPSTAKSVEIVPGSLNRGPLLHQTILTNPGNWSANFLEALNASHPEPFTAVKPVLVNIGTPLLQFPLSYDDPYLISNFGRLLIQRPDVRRIAAAVLYALSKKHSLNLDPGKITPGKFYGAHLRTGNDAKVAGWTGYEVQSANYLATAEHYKLPAIYLVSSSVASIAAFTVKAANLSIATETKDTLLGGAELRGEKGFEDEWRALERMNWDVQLLVDYEVLLRSSIFGGVWESSFSWGVAMRRHVVASGDGGWKGIAMKSKRGFPDQQLRTRRELSSEASAQAERDISKRRESSLVKKEAQEKKTETVAAPAGSPEYNVKVGATSFKDGLSVIFGPQAEGKRIRGSLWP